MLYNVTWNGCDVPVRLDDPVFSSRTERFLTIPVIPSAAPDDGGPTTTAMRRNKRGWELDSPLCPLVAAREDDAAFMLFESLVCEFGMRSTRPVAHAGAFVKDGGAILYLAGPHQGKSRLSFAAWRRGFPTLGDDCIALLSGGRAVKSLPKCLKLRLDGDRVPPDWRAAVPDGDAFVGNVDDEWRWVLSRRLSGVVDCEAVVPVRAVVLLRRVDAGPTRLDEVPVPSALADVLPYTALGGDTPMDLLRFINMHARQGRIRRLNVAPGEVERGVDLLATL